MLRSAGLFSLATALPRVVAQVNPSTHDNGSTMTRPSESANLVELVSPWGFAQTLLKVTGTIEGAGLKVFTVIDHAAAAAGAGLKMPPTTVLLYGRAEGGTPIMLAAPNTALDLPLRVLVREGGGGLAVVAFHPIAQALASLGAPEALVHRLDPAQQLLVNALRT